MLSNSRDPRFCNQLLKAAGSPLPATPSHPCLHHYKVAERLYRLLCLTCSPSLPALPACSWWLA